MHSHGSSALAIYAVFQMQITETVSDGLKRELKVIVPAAELKSRAATKLEDIQGKVKLNGFRPGKVPMERVRQLYGRSVMAEILEQAVGETSQKALEERKERPAFQPDIKLPEDQAAVERIIDGMSDLEYTMSFEVLPRIALADLTSITLEKEVATPAADDIDKALKRLMDANVSYELKSEPAATGDKLTIDFKGSIDGVPFEGGAGEDAAIVLGSNQFIPGFEAGLEGAVADEDRQVTVTFPADYQAEALAGKEAVFEVRIKDVSAPVAAKADDDFAKTLGLESFEKLNDAIRGQLQKELDNASRAKLKKQLLDALDENHSFDIPASLVDAEFEGIWRNYTKQMEQARSSFEAEGTTEDKSRDEYRKTAERRVRLGLVLSEIGTENQIKITDDELRRAMIDRAKQFPGQERLVLEFYKKNPNAINELRAPVYEEKVINFALERVKLEEKSVTSQELLAFAEQQERDEAIFEDKAEGIDNHEHDHGHVHGPDCNHDHDHSHHDHGNHKHEHK